MTNKGSKRRQPRSQRSKLKRESFLDQVKIEDTFVFSNPQHASSARDADGTSASVGEGCYVSSIVNNRRYYGVMVDQEALKAGSILHFQDDSRRLDLDRRMVELFHKQREETTSNGVRKHSVLGNEEASTTSEDIIERGLKRQRSSTIVSGGFLSTGNSELLQSVVNPAPSQTVQKFRYTPGNETSVGYYEFLASYTNINAAAEDDPERVQTITAACHAGGDFAGNYYYQFEPININLVATQTRLRVERFDRVRTSVDFQSFLRKLDLPRWSPLSKLEQQQVINIINSKQKDKGGNDLADKESTKARTSLRDVHEMLAPMQSRSIYRVVVVGGGIAGLSSCIEIFRRCEKELIDVEVVLLEGRSRLGGRLWTDRETFKTVDGVTEFPVDLGASWIHGIDLNPLTLLAKEAGIDFIRTSEDVKILKGNMQEIDLDEDRHADEFFDKLLDAAAEKSWSMQDFVDESGPRHCQSAIRWYASGLNQLSSNASIVVEDTKEHRRSTDISVDRAVGNVIANQLSSAFCSLSKDERRMLLWNLKNVEYALGASMSDLSMKFWDIDERHAFNGDHVILRQGYHVIITHLLQQLQKRGDRFTYHLNFSVQEIAYARKITSKKVLSPSRNISLDISDACNVTSRSGDSIKCDMVVCCVPLGVLKESIRLEPFDSPSKILFSPPLPFVKIDAIQATGFGILNKLFIHFPVAFWRRGKCGLAEDTYSFGNASNVHPHHFMFFDIGKSLGNNHLDASPAILMSLVSGKAAVRCECMTDDAVIHEVVKTLRVLFPDIDIPYPIAFRVTRWGKDPFSRGSHTFLPPGTTDEDFRALQSPINGNGDSIVLEGKETMRLFFAGEHTTAMHPSMAHGAFLSGVRAGKEVVDALHLDFKQDPMANKLIPISLYRHMNPNAPLQCNFCHVVGGNTNEGPLLALKRGSRQVLVHRCCAEYSPEVEVEVEDGQWRNLVKAVNRSASVECAICQRLGASIRCNEKNCSQSFHFRCAELSGWKFQDDGKVYYCERHNINNNKNIASTMETTHFAQPTETSPYQHALFAAAASSPMLETCPVVKNETNATFESESDCHGNTDALREPLKRIKLTLIDEGFPPKPTRLLRMHRPSTNELWNLELKISPTNNDEENNICVSQLVLASAGNIDDPVIKTDEMKNVDFSVKSLNGHRIGSSRLNTVANMIQWLAQEVDVLLEVIIGVDDDL